MNPSPTHQDLKRELEQAGCFETAPLYAFFALIGNLATSIALFLLAKHSPSLIFSVPLFVLGSFFFYRLGWLMHDAAHNGTFKTPKANESFANLTAGILGEFPSGWRHGHNIHHAHTNIRGKDFDQRERWDETRRYSSRMKAWLGLFSFTRIKGKYFPHTLIFLGIRDGYYCHKFWNKRFKRELTRVLISFACQFTFFCLVFGGWGPLFFFIHTHIGMVYLNTVFAANHYDLENFLPEETSNLSFEELQARTTRNYRGGWYQHFVYGGLEKQLEHHLFPHLPRHQLKNASRVVRSFCERRGLPYHEEYFSRAFLHVLDFHVVGKEKC